MPMELDKSTAPEIPASKSKNPAYDMVARKSCVDVVCQILAESETGIRRICDQLRKHDPTFPAARTIREWINEDSDIGRECYAAYARAKDLQLQYIAEQIIDISDDSSEDEILTDDGRRLCNNEFVQRSKLRVDSRKWLLSKLVPRVYGDNQRIEHDISDNLAEQMRQARERRQALMGRVIPAEIVE